MDLVSVPVAFIVLAISLRSSRLLILPFCSLIVAGATSFGIMGILAMDKLSVSSATPPLMMSILLAISIDYALFLLTRFREEVEKGAKTDIVLQRVLMYSGHTVCGSGFTLAFCFLALVFFPLDMIKSIGLGVMITIFSAIIVNMTLVPAALMAMPTFFSNFNMWGCDCFCCCCKKRAPTPPQPPEAEEGSLIPVGPASISTADGKPFEKTLWFRWAMFSTSPCATVLTLIIIGVFGALALVKLTSMEKSLDTFLMMSREADSIGTMKRFGNSFSMGSIG